MCGMRTVDLSDRPLNELMRAAVIVYDAAGFSGVELAIALDRLYRAYTGQSALKAAGVQEDWLRKAEKVEREDRRKKK